MVLKPLTFGQTHCNGRIKISPNGGVYEVLYTSRPVFNFGGFEPTHKNDRLGGERGKQGGEGDPQSKKRAYKKVFDYATCNEDVFDLFITLTLDQKEVDRYSWEAVYKKLKVWLDNRVQRKGLKYLIVPERHKDGAIHFHGLINSSAVKLQDSGKRYWKKDSISYGKHIYNITDWKLGFTTAVKLSGDYEHVCKYISKYITKQTEGGLIGGRYYYHGGDLAEPTYRYINFLSPPEGREYKIEEAGLTVVYVDDLSKCQYENASVPKEADGKAVKVKGGDLQSKYDPALTAWALPCPIMGKGGAQSQGLGDPPVDKKRGAIYDNRLYPGRNVSKTFGVLDARERFSPPAYDGHGYENFRRIVHTPGQYGRLAGI